MGRSICGCVGECMGREGHDVRRGRKGGGENCMCVLSGKDCASGTLNLISLCRWRSQDWRRCAKGRMRC